MDECLALVLQKFFFKIEETARKYDASPEYVAGHKKEACRQIALMKEHYKYE